MARGECHVKTIVNMDSPATHSTTNSGCSVSRRRAVRTLMANVRVLTLTLDAQMDLLIFHRLVRLVFRGMVRVPDPIAEDEANAGNSHGHHDFLLPDVIPPVPQSEIIIEIGIRLRHFADEFDAGRARMSRRFRLPRSLRQWILLSNSVDTRELLCVVARRMENCVQLVNSVSSDDVLSSNLSTDDCHSKSLTNQSSERLTKNGVRPVIDKKIFLKFHKLTRTLKETRTNLLNVDQMLGQYRANPKFEPMNNSNNNSGSANNYQGVRPRGRRTASVPPPLRISNCQLCGGDNPQLRCQSVDNLETNELSKCDKSPLSRQSQSMQDLRVPTTPLHSSREILSTYFQGKTDDPAGDNLNSARGSDISLGEHILIKSDDSYFKSTQLASATVEEIKSDILGLKSQLQKLELTGQFQTQQSLLCQQVEMKDRIISEMSHHLQELSNKLEISEEQRCQLLLRLEDTLRTSLDVGSEAERFAAEVKRVEEMAADVQADKERLRRKARKIVLELKEKCKQYLSDTQRLKEHEWELEQKNTAMTQENKLLEGQVASLQEKLQKAVGELDAYVTRRDESQQRLQQKELEVTEMKAVYQEIQKNIQNYKEANQKLLTNNEAIKSRYDTLKNEKTHLDIKLVAMDKELMLSLQRLEELKTEVKGLRVSNNEFQAQILTESSLKQAANHAGQEMAEKINTLETQLSALQNKYLETVSDHTKVTEQLRQDAVNSKFDEDQKLQELSKSVQLQYDSRFTSLKLDRAENQAKVQSLEEALAKEQELKIQVKTELTRLQDETATNDDKYRQLQKSYLSKKKKLQEKKNQMQYLQESYIEVRDMAKTLDEDFKGILYLIYNDVEATVSMLASGSNIPPPIPNLDSQQPKQILSRDWLASIKSQLRWIQDEISRLPSAIIKTQRHTVSVDSVHTNVPLQLPVPKMDLKFSSSSMDARHNPSPLYLIEKSERSLQAQPPTSEATTTSQEVTTEAGGNEESLHYPLNSTEITGSQKSNWESTQTEILKRYQRFQKIFDNINADFSKSIVRFDSGQQQGDATKVPASSGGLSSSSLSSISEFSCDAAVEEITSDTVNDVLKIATNGSELSSPPVPS